jgi:hypothetical protein
MFLYSHSLILSLSLARDKGEKTFANINVVISPFRLQQIVENLGLFSS